MTPRFLITDIATAPLPNVADFLEPVDSESRRPPSNYTKAETIAEWRQKDYQADLTKAGLDPDLSRITGIGLWDTATSAPVVYLCRTEDEERSTLVLLARLFTCPLMGYNALKFDWPFLMRRGAYLGVPIVIGTDRYRSNNVDLMDVLTHRGALAAKPLGFYARRLQMGVSKPLSGAEEARVPETGRWEELGESLRHDVTVTRRIGEWQGVLAPARPLEAEPTF